MTTSPPSTGTTLFASSDAEIRSAFPVMRQLRPHLDEAAFVEWVKQAAALPGEKM